MYVSRKAIKCALLGVIGFSVSVYFINAQASKDAKETSVPDVDPSSSVFNSNEGIDATTYISYLSLSKISKVTILLNKDVKEDGINQLMQDAKKIMDGDDSVDTKVTSPKKKQTTLALISILKDDDKSTDAESIEWNDMLDQLKKIYEVSPND